MQYDKKDAGIYEVVGHVNKQYFVCPVCEEMGSRCKCGEKLNKDPLLLKTDVVICQSTDHLKDFSTLLTSSSSRILPDFTIKDPYVNILKAFGIQSKSTTTDADDSDDSIEILEDLPTQNKLFGTLGYDSDEGFITPEGHHPHLPYCVKCGDPGHTHLECNSYYYQEPQ